MYLIKEMPKDDRPRERLFADGVTALSNEELIAVLLRTGRKDVSVIDLSKQVLFHLESMADLRRITPEELCLIPGIKEAKAATLVAAIELGRRLSMKAKTEKTIIKTPMDVYDLMAPDLSHLEQEHFICLFLNVKSELIKKETIFIGTVNQTLIHPREIFKLGIRLSAAAVILVHNHPTGDSTPSKADEKATVQLREASQLVGIDCLDHIIIGNKEYYSIVAGKKVRL